MLSLVLFFLFQGVLSEKCTSSVYIYGVGDDNYYCIRDNECSSSTCANIMFDDKCIPYCQGTLVGNGKDIYDKKIVCSDVFTTPAVYCDDNTSDGQYVYYILGVLGGVLLLIAKCLFFYNACCKSEPKKTVVKSTPVYSPPVYVPKTTPNAPVNVTKPSPVYTSPVYTLSDFSNNPTEAEFQTKILDFVNKQKQLCIDEYSARKITKKILLEKVKALDDLLLEALS